MVTPQSRSPQQTDTKGNKMPTSKTRISVPLSAEIALAIRSEAQKVGVSESAYCAFIIGQHIMSQSQIFKIVEQQLKELEQKKPKEKTE